MQAATRRSIHSAFVQLQLQSRCRRPSSLLLQRHIAAARGWGNNGIILLGDGSGASAARGVRWLSGSGVKRDGKSAGDDDGDKPVAEGGATSAGKEGGGVGRGGAGEDTVEGFSKTSVSTSSSLSASAPNQTEPAASSASSTLPDSSETTSAGAPSAEAPESGNFQQSQSQSQSQSPESQSLSQQASKPRGRPIGSGNTKRRQPAKFKEKEVIPNPEVPEWFFKASVMMVEDNLSRPTRLELWITPDREDLSKEQFQEALEVYRVQAGEEGENQAAVIENITSTDGVAEVATEEGITESAAATAGPPPLPPRPGEADSNPESEVVEEEVGVDATEKKEEEITAADSLETSESVEDSDEKHRISFTIPVNKFIQVDHALREGFPAIPRDDRMLNAAAEIDEAAESHITPEFSIGKAQCHPRYGLQVYVWREIMANVAAGLALPKNTSNDSDVATKSHVLLKCPREGGIYFLDTIVEHIASLSRADIVRIDPQDLEEMAGDYLGDTKYFSLSNITSQKIRSLGYDAQSQSQSVAVAKEEDQEEDQEEEEEFTEGPVETQPPTQYFPPVPPPSSANSIRTMVTILPATAPGGILLPSSSQAIDSDRRNEKKVYKLLEALIDSAAAKRAQQNSSPVYQDPWNSDSNASQDDTQVPSAETTTTTATTTTTTTTDATTPLKSHQKTIIHIRDYSELQRTPQGSTIIRMMHDIITKRRKNGHPMVIVGTTSSSETSHSLTKSNIESTQELTADDFERTIIVPPAKSPADHDLDLIMENDRKSRIKEVNIRHLRDIIRRRSGEGKAGIELKVPNDWHLMSELDVESVNIEGIDEEMWNFDRTHRIATVAIGLYHKYFQSLQILPTFTQPLPASQQQQQQKDTEEDDNGSPATTTTTSAATATTAASKKSQEQEYTRGVLTIQNINRAVSDITKSDDFKFAWAATERRRLRTIEKEESEQQQQQKESTTEDDDVDADPLLPSGLKKPKGASSELIKKLSKSCNAHEQKLLSGVINPDKIHVGFNSVRAPPETIEALKTLTSLSLLRPEAFQYGVLATDRIPGVLLYGPPGTGKTLLARAVAKESGATVLEVSGSDIFDMYVGEGEKNVKAIFSLATRLSPCIIFLDEADAILGSRSSSGTRTTHREIINQFLREWADLPLTPTNSTFLMVATNRPFDLDDAVLRRLPRRILVDLPSLKDRLEILKIHLKEEVLGEDVDLEALSKLTPLYSGSDLKNVCVAAALAAVKEEYEESLAYKRKKSTTETTSSTYIYPSKRILLKKHFEKALNEVGASIGEDMGSLGAMRKWDEKFGEGKGRKRGNRGMGFGGGKDGSGTGGGVVDEGVGRVRKPLLY